MTGLKASDTLDSYALREEQFLMRVQAYRERVRRLPIDSGATITMERDLDRLLMEQANLAREPLLRYMSKAMEHAAALAPSPFTTYPDPRKGAVAANPTHTPDLVNVLTRMVTDYLRPDAYATRFGGLYQLPAGYQHTGMARDKAFINDVVHLVDNPQHVPPKEPGQ